MAESVQSVVCNGTSHKHVPFPGFPSFPLASLSSLSYFIISTQEALCTAGLLFFRVWTTASFSSCCLAEFFVWVCLPLFPSLSLPDYPLVAEDIIGFQETKPTKHYQCSMLTMLLTVFEATLEIDSPG